jgi:hypothetical protein
MWRIAPVLIIGLLGKEMQAAGWDPYLAGQLAGFLQAYIIFSPEN